MISIPLYYFLDSFLDLKGVMDEREEGEEKEEEVAGGGKDLPVTEITLKTEVYLHLLEENNQRFSIVIKLRLTLYFIINIRMSTKV